MAMQLQQQELTEEEEENFGPLPIKRLEVGSLLSLYKMT